MQASKFSASEHRFSLRRAGTAFRWAVLVGGLVAGLIGAAVRAEAQKASSKTAGSAAQELPPIEEKTLRASDGWPIHIIYLPSPMKKDGPVVVLLHRQGSNSLVWLRKRGLARLLQNAGYAVIAVDLRKHGKSKRKGGPTRSARRAGSGGGLKRADYQAMVARDLEAVKGFIYREHQQQKLNMRKLALVAAEMSCPIAINYTVLDWLKKPYDDAPSPEAATPRGQDVQALVLLSPDTSCPGVVTARAIPFIKARPISVLICVGAEDSDYVKNAKRIFQQLGGEHQTVRRVYYKAYPGKLRGTDLLGKPSIQVEKLIRGFLDKHLKALSGPRYDWRDRRSPLLK